MTDEQIMHRVCAGEISLVSELFERHHRKLFRYAWRMTGDTQMSEDLVQDVFVKVLRHRDTFGAGSSFAAWMYSIARNAQNDSWRKRKREVPLDPRLEVAAAEPAVRGQENEMLHRALLLLPDEMREVLVMHRFLGMSHADIAQATGCDSGTSRARMHRALNRLRRVYLGMTRRRIS